MAAAGYGKALAGATQLLTMFYKQMAATLQVGGSNNSSSIARIASVCGAYA